MNIIGHKKIFLGIAGVLVVLSVVLIAVFGLRQGIDFKGGTLWEISFQETGVSREAFFEGVQGEEVFRNAIVTASTDGKEYLIRIEEISEEDHARYLAILEEKFGAIDELRFEAIGATIGYETQRKAITAFILVLVAISLYTAFAFRKVSYPVSSWKYGIVTLVTLFHDTIIPAGLFALLGYFMNVEVGINFIVAILIVMGFSVHDTIVVFDRIRENLRISRKETSFEKIVNISINQTIARSINTSLTLILVLVSLYLFGSAALLYFILAILVGVVVGTYSSIFVASPLLTLLRKGGE